MSLADLGIDSVTHMVQTLARPLIDKHYPCRPGLVNDSRELSSFRRVSRSNVSSWTSLLNCYDTTCGMDKVRQSTAATSVRSLLAEHHVYIAQASMRLCGGSIIQAFFRADWGPQGCV